MSQINKSSSQYIQSQVINKQVKSVKLDCIRLYRSEYKNGDVRLKYYNCRRVSTEQHQKMIKLGFKSRIRTTVCGYNVHDYLICIK